MIIASGREGVVMAASMEGVERGEPVVIVRPGGGAGGGVADESGYGVGGGEGFVEDELSGSSAGAEEEDVHFFLLFDCWERW
jgi:hypothetical protein